MYTLTQMLKNQSKHEAGTEMLKPKPYQSPVVSASTIHLADNQLEVRWGERED